MTQHVGQTLPGLTLCLLDVNFYGALAVLCLRSARGPATDVAQCFARLGNVEDMIYERKGDDILENPKT